MQETQQRAEIEKQFSHASFHDALTGLPNRLYFMNRLERALRRSRRQPKYQVAIIVLDIDRFKSINEALGHAAGDELLVQAVQRLESCLRPADLVVARIGADELAFLLFDIQHLEAATIVAQRLQRSLDEPFVLERQNVFVTASMGIAISSMAYDNADELIRAADIALSKAKAEDRARYEVFDPATRDQVVSRQQLESDLRRAIEQDELRLHFQPIVSFDTGRIAGMEVLVRWQHPLEGMIPPSRFVPLAEESGLVVSLNRWVMQMACRQARAWQEELPEDVTFYLSVNLSARDLRQPDLCDFVAALLEENGVPKGMLRAEVTEGSMISDVKSASELVARLREIGVPLLLDDFGTGYSSLSYLQLFKFDYLKIDQAFVRRVTPAGQNLGIIRAIVHIAEDLGIQTIAEGIESAEVAEQLRSLGCRYAQGYYFSKPVEANRAEQLLRSRREYSFATKAMATL
jgi:Amt family ammonium transporter